MANDFLIKKWKQLFHLNDINKDDHLSLKDADAFAERFSAAHKFDNERAKQVKEKACLIWKDFVMVSTSDRVTEAEYVLNLTKKINSDREKLCTQLTESMKMFAEIIDVNNDGLISTEEVMRTLHAWGSDNVLDETFVAKFPQAKPGFIKIDDFVKPWVEHLMNTDKAAYNPVTEGLQALSDAGLLP